MSEEKIIGKGTWIDKLAAELIEREKKIGRNLDLIRVESGLGASGIPHIGSLGDAVRAYGVKLALENQGYKSELIAYSDDLDGLRKVPEGMQEFGLEEHIGKPVSLIPDPYGCHDSYGMHMSSILLDGLDKVGIKYEFRRAIDTYKQGLLKDHIHTILQNSTKIGDAIDEINEMKTIVTKKGILTKRGEALLDWIQNELIDRAFMVMTRLKYQDTLKLLPHSVVNKRLQRIDEFVDSVMKSLVPLKQEKLILERFQNHTHKIEPFKI